jgi:hypothetical protein
MLVAGTAFASALFASAAIGDWFEKKFGIKEKIAAREKTAEYQEIRKAQEEAAKAARNRNDPARQKTVQENLGEFKKKYNLTNSDFKKDPPGGDIVVITKEGHPNKGLRFNALTGQEIPVSAPVSTSQTPPAPTGESVRAAPDTGSSAATGAGAGGEDLNRVTDTAPATGGGSSAPAGTPTREGTSGTSPTPPGGGSSAPAAPASGGGGGGGGAAPTGAPAREGTSGTSPAAPGGAGGGTTSAPAETASGGSGGGTGTPTAAPTGGTAPPAAGGGAPQRNSSTASGDPLNTITARHWMLNHPDVAAAYAALNSADKQKAAEMASTGQESEARNFVLSRGSVPKTLPAQMLTGGAQTVRGLEPASAPAAPAAPASEGSAAPASTPVPTAPPAPPETPAAGGGGGSEPVVINNNSSQSSDTTSGGEGNNIAGQNFALSVTNPFLNEYLQRQNEQYA